MELAPSLDRCSDGFEEFFILNGTQVIKARSHILDNGTKITSKKPVLESVWDAIYKKYGDHAGKILEDLSVSLGLRKKELFGRVMKIKRRHRRLNA